MSSLERCALFSLSFIERFHCSTNTTYIHTYCIYKLWHGGVQITHLLRLLFLCLILLCRQIILLSSTLDPVLLLLAVQRKRWKASYWPPWSSNSNRARNRDLFHTYVPATRAIKINKKQRSVSHVRARHKGYQNQQETEICFTRTCPPQGLSKSTRNRDLFHTNVPATRAIKINKRKRACAGDNERSLSWWF